jgi:hypothetical protein
MFFLFFKMRAAKVTVHIQQVFEKPAMERAPFAIPPSLSAFDEENSP